MFVIWALFLNMRRKIRLPTIAKQVNDRGFGKTYNGKKGITTYIISKRSMVIELVSNGAE
jgi:hypothetical protein